MPATLAASLVSVALLLAPLIGSAAEKLPSRNLLIEWRLSDVAAKESQGGAVTLRSDGTGMRGGVTVGTRGAQRRGEGTSRLMVLNGATATLRLTASHPWQFMQVAWSGAGASSASRGVALDTRWIDSGQGLQVQPRWSAGAADVIVDFQADSISASVDPALGDGSMARKAVRATLQMPLGEWTTVAEYGESEEQDARGVLSSRQVRSAERQSLQLRISLP